MASPSAMAKCLRADAAVMLAENKAVIGRAEGMAQVIVSGAGGYLEMAPGGRSPFLTAVLMLAAAAALEANDAEG